MTKETAKSASINLALTTELKSFVQKQAGDDTLYSTPSEFIRDLIRHEKERQEAANLRQGIIDGYRDVIQGRTVKFSGDLRQDLKSFE